MQPVIQTSVFERSMTTQSINLDAMDFSTISLIKPNSTAYVCITYQGDSKRLHVNVTNLDVDHAMELLRRATMALGASKFRIMYETPVTPSGVFDSMCAVFLHPTSATVSVVFSKVNVSQAIDLLRFGSNQLEVSRV
jgi:hypothetical protein